MIAADMAITVGLHGAAAGAAVVADGRESLATS
jgi:hypothetical protein